MIPVPHSGHLPPIRNPRRLYPQCSQAWSPRIGSPRSAALYLRYLSVKNWATAVLMIERPPGRLSRSCDQLDRDQPVDEQPHDEHADQEGATCRHLRQAEAAARRGCGLDAGGALADALHDASDHLPVVVDDVVSCPADLDLDGDVGINDFLAVLAAWGACP